MKNSTLQSMFMHNPNPATTALHKLYPHHSLPQQLIIDMVLLGVASQGHPPLAQLQQLAPLALVQLVQLIQQHKT
eukprot:538294-Pelagomonas_calceolata.AAC.1